MRNVNTALSFIHHQSVGTKLYSQSPPPLHGLHFLYFISTRKCDISLVLICLGAERNGDEVMYQAATRVDALKHVSRNVQLRELFPAVSIQTCLCLLNSAFSALAQSFARCGNADILRKKEGGGLENQELPRNSLWIIPRASPLSYYMEYWVFSSLSVFVQTELK